MSEEELKKKAEELRANDLDKEKIKKIKEEHFKAR